MPDSARKSEKKKQETGMVTGIIITGVGALFLLNNLDVLDFGDSWPLILILAGVTLIVGSRGRRGDVKNPAERTE